MSGPVEEKLVRLKLDNSNLKLKAAESKTVMSSLKSALSKIGEVSIKGITSQIDKLKNSLAGVNAGKAKTEISSLGNGGSLTGLQKAIDTVNSRFSTMGVVSTQVLNNIVNKAMAAGTSLKNAFGTGPIRQGFQEYEMNINSVRAIMANLEGVNLKQVNSALDNLNEYADKTVYSFSDMTSAIGRFTAAGVGLDDSVTAIKGLGNLAAAGGANAEQLSRAYVQIAQALSSGTFRLQDWSSINNANLNTAKFRDTLQEVALAKGTLDQKFEKGEFRESLKKDWLTADVFLETMRRFSNDPSMLKAATEVTTFTQLVGTLKEAIGSGWAQSFRLLVGDYEQSTQLFTRLNDVIGGAFDAASDRRNAILKEFVGLGGRDSLYNSLFKVVDLIQHFGKIVGRAWELIFPPVTAQGLLNMAKGIESFTDKLKLGNNAANTLGYILKGVFSAIKAGMTIAKEIGLALSKVFHPSLVNGAIKLAQVISTWAQMFAKVTAQGGGVIPIIRQIGEGIYKVSGIVGDALTKFARFLAFITVNWKQVSALLQNGFKFAVASILAMLNNLKNKVLEIGKSFGVDNIFKNNPFDSLKKMLSSGLDGMIGSVKEFFGGIGDRVRPIIDGVVNEAIRRFNNLKDKVVAVMSFIKMTASAVWEFIKGLAAYITPEKVVGGAVLAGLYMTVKKAMDLADELPKLAKKILNFDDIIGKASNANKLLMYAGAIAAIVYSITKFSDLSNNDAFLGITALAGALVTLHYAFKKINSEKGNYKNLLALGVTIMMLSRSLKTLSGAEAKNLPLAALALSGVIAALSMVTKAMQDIKITDGVGRKFIAISIAVKGLSNAMSTLGSLDSETLLQGTLAVSALMGGLTLVTIAITRFSQGITGQAPVMLAGAASMIAIAAAINMMVPPIAALGFIPVGNLIAGVGTITAVAIVLGTATAALGGLNAGGMLAGAAGMIGIAAAINIIIPPLMALSFVPYDRIEQGMLMLAAAVGIVTVPLVALGLLGPAVAAAGVAFLGLAMAIGPLVAAVTALGVIPWQATAMGIGMLTAAITAVGLAMGIIGTLLGPGMLAFGAAVASVGAGAGIAAAALGLLAAGIGALAAGLALLGPSLSTIGAGMKDFIQGMDAAMTSFLLMMVKFLVGVAALAPMAGAAMGSIMGGFAMGMAVQAPALAAGIVTLGISLINALADTLVNNAGLILQALANLLGAVVSMVIEGIVGLLSHLPFIGDDIKNFADDVSSSVKEMVSGSTEDVKQSVEGVAESAEEASDRVNSAGQKADKWADPMKVSANEADKSISNMFTEDRITGKAKAAGESGKQGFLEGLDMPGIDSMMNSDFLSGFDIGGIGDKLKGGISGLDLEGFMSSMGMDGGTAFNESLKQGLGDDSIFDILKGNAGTDEFSDLMKQTGEEGAKGLEEGLATADLGQTSETMWDAWKSGLSAEEFTEYGKTLGYNFSHGLWSGNHITDAGVEMMNQLQSALGSDKLAELGRLMGYDLSSGLTHHGGQYVTEAGAEIVRRLSQGTLSNEALAMIAQALGLELQNQITDAGNQAAQAAEEKGKEVGQAMGDGVTEGVKGTDVSTPVNEHLEASIDPNAGSVKAREAGMNSAKGYEEGAKSVDVSSVGTSIMSALSNVLAAAEYMASSKAAGTAIVMSFKSGLESEAGNVSSAGTTLAESLVKSLTDVDATPAGNNLGDEFTKGLSDKNGVATQAARLLAEATRKSAEDVDATPAGQNLGDEFVRGLDGTKGSAVSTAQGIANSSVDAMRISAYDSGSYLVAGFADGISGSAYLAVNAASYAASAAKRAINSTLGIASPARKLIPSGRWFNAGLAMGIRNNVDIVEEAASDLGLIAVDSLNQIINSTEAEEVWEPVIRPIWDDSNLPTDPINQNGIISAEYRNQMLTNSRIGGALVSGGSSSSSTVYNNTINNGGIFDGATFNVRSDEDIESIASEVDRILKRNANMDDIFNRGK